jgi:hypothetical protein
MPKIQETELNEALIKTIQSIGPQKTKAILEKASKETVESRNILYCITAVCDKIGITKIELKAFNLRSDERKIAIGLIYYYLRNIYCIKHKALAELLPMHVGIQWQMILRCHKIITGSKKENPKTNLDKIVQRHFKPLSDLFINHKKEISICQPKKIKPQAKKK